MPAKIKRPLTSLKWITTDELAARWGVTAKHITYLLDRGRARGCAFGRGCTRWEV